MERALYIKSVRDELRIVLRALDGITTEELNWRPQTGEANSLFVIATHVLGSTTVNVIEYLGGESVGRDRDAEFRASGESAELLLERGGVLLHRIEEIIQGLPDDVWDREYAHHSGERITGRGILHRVLTHNHVHGGEAMLVHDLIMAQRPG